MKKFFFTTALVLLVILAMEGISAVGLVYLKKKKGHEYYPAIRNKLTAVQKENLRRLLNAEEQYVAFSPELGWAIKPNGAKNDYRSNAQGIRADHDYAPHPEGKIRIAAFGDSFVHCDEVGNAETWEEHLNTMDPGLETINFGVGGYGTDQSFLRYLEEGRKFHPDIVIIGFMTENPTRNLTVFRPFYHPQTGLPLSKPRFDLDGQNLRLIKNPLNNMHQYERLMKDEKTVLLELSKNDYFYNYRYAGHPLDVFRTVRLYKVLRSLYMKPKEKIFNKLEYNANSKVYKVTAAVLEEFYNTVKKDGAIPIIVFIPNSGDFGRFKDHRARIYQPFRDMMDRKGMTYVDFTEDFLNEILSDEHPETFFAPRYHFSGRGNQSVAKYIYRFLRENNYLNLKERPAGKQ